MSMQFATVQAFITMGGHGTYVWVAVLVSLSVLIGLIVRPLHQQRKIIDSIARQQRIQNAEQLILKDSDREEVDASNS